MKKSRNVQSRWTSKMALWTIAQTVFLSSVAEWTPNVWMRKKINLVIW